MNALTAWIDRTQREFLGNEPLRLEATHEIARWTLATFHVPIHAESWDRPWTLALREAIRLERLNEASLRADAAAAGFDLVPFGADEPTPKRSRTAVTTAGRKRTRSGSLPPSHTHTPQTFQVDVPLVSDEPQGDLGGPVYDAVATASGPPSVRTEGSPVVSQHAASDIERVDAEMSDVPAPSTEARLPGLESSMHAPSAAVQAPAPIDPALAAILAGLGKLTETVSSFTVKFTDIEARMKAVEAGNIAPPLPAPRPMILSPRPTPADLPDTPIPVVTDKGKGRAVPALPLPGPAMDVDFPALAPPAPAPKPSFANVSRPKPGVILPPSEWKTVGKSKTAAPARTTPLSTGSSVKEILTTKVTVIRAAGCGGTGWDQTVDQIVMTDRTIIERISPKPPQLLGGQWCKKVTVGQPPVRTGNFTYTFAGDLPFPSLLPYTNAMLEPLGDGRIVPGEKWTWAQLDRKSVV